MKYKYEYTGSGTMGFYVEGKRYVVSKENDKIPSEVTFEHKINIPGMKLIVEKVPEEKKTKKKKGVI